MDIISMYSVKIKEYRHIFKESLQIYRSAVNFFIDVCLKEWDDFSSVVKSQSKLWEADFKIKKEVSR